MRRTVQVVGTILALVILALVSLPLLINADRFRPALESKLSDALDRKVTIGSLSVSLLSGGVAADELVIADDPAFGQEPFLQAKSFQVAVELWPLIVSRKLIVTGLTIGEPQVALRQSAEGRWNYSSLGGKFKPAGLPSQEPAAADSLDLSAKLIRVVNGRLSVGKTSGRQKPLGLESVNVEVRDFASAASFPFSFHAKVAGGGDVTLEGKAGPTDGTDAALTPLSATLDVKQLNLAAVLAGTAPDISGTTSLNASADSSNGRLTLRGRLTTEGLKLARNGTPSKRAVAFDFDTSHDLHQHSGVLKRGDLHIGAATGSMVGSYAERGESMVLGLKFTGTSLPVPELAELLPPLGIALPRGSSLEGGTAAVAFIIEGPADRLVADGSVSLDQTRLANFDLGTKMTILEKLVGIKSGPNTDIEVLRAKLSYSPNGTSVQDIQLVAQGIGELKGSGAVSPTNALDFRMSATIQTSRSALLSKTAVPFSIQGTATDPVFKPDVGGLAAAQAKSLLQTEAQKRLKGTAGEAAGGLLDRLFGGKKK